VGRFEAEFFDPVKWKPEYPNPAFDNMRPDDAFWAARLVARFSDEAIHAVVAKARYSEPGASEYIAKTLIARRDKVLRAWLTAVNPIVNVAIDAAGLLTFQNAAIDAGVAQGPVSYELSWLEFDNATGATTAVGEPARTNEPRATVPDRLVGDREYIALVIKTQHADYPVWQLPVTVFFRRDGAGWRTVGLDRTIP
jgi:hypothetical protein